MRYLFLCALLLSAFVYSSSAQEVNLYPIRWAPAPLIDYPDAFGSLDLAGKTDDSTAVWMQKVMEPDGIACPELWFGIPETNGQPVAAPHDSAASVSFWLKAADTVIVQIGFDEFAFNNGGIMRTLHGPFDWQKVTIPLIGGEKTALYYAVMIPFLDAQNKYENRYNARVYLGPVTIDMQQASVEFSAAVENPEPIRVRWYNLLGQYQGDYTRDEAVRELPKNIQYITSDGKQYFIGR